MADKDAPLVPHIRYNSTMDLLPQCLSRKIRHGRSSPGPGLLAAGLIATALSGCAKDGPEAAFTHYQERLARSLAADAGTSTSTRIPPLPAPRDLIITIPGGTLDALDFLALSGCAVQVTAGKRHSSLGRTARASQRLLLELEYLQLAPACSAHLRGQGETVLATNLEQAWRLKYHQLPALIFNATLGSAEYREFWNIPATPGDYPSDTGCALLSSLEAINELARRWLAGDFRADNPYFETLLGAVARGDAGTPKQRYHELLPPIVALEETLEATLPNAYRDWRRQRDTLLAKLPLAPNQYVTERHTLQATCKAGAARKLIVGTK